ANNSVRVTEDFMQAVEAGDDWDLTARVTGEPLETIPARELMREIADAAWRCADPGVQYDTTINRWHTSPESGRINASNPCSEYMHVDDSACNLASINLMKFRRADGSFDVDRFAHATVLAPTGTISFLMDCDTTGIEPDFSLVKFKELVGGGQMTIVNRTVPMALRTLGYSDTEIEQIEAYINDKATIVGAPGLKDEHLPVFDVAVGERAISHMGHIRMMSAVQPFLSGAISKTVNLPESATVEDIADAYTQGWKLGLKALAIYRDGSKTAQALRTDAGDKKSEPAAEEAPAEQRPVRRKMPREREAITHKFSIAGHEGYITAGKYPDGSVGEIFLTDIGKE